MPTGWTPSAVSSTLDERTFSRLQQCSCFTITVFYGVLAGRAESLRMGFENMENLMTVVDRLDELQESSVGRRECSSTRQRKGAKRMDVHVDTESALPTGDGLWPLPRHNVMEARGSGICAALCIWRTLCRHVTIGTPMVIFCCLTVFLLFLTICTLLVEFW